MAGKALYRFDRFTLDGDRAVLLGENGVEVPLRPKSLAVLRHLVEHAGEPVDRDQILQAVWPGVYVTDDSIGQCVKDVRRALGDDEQRLVRTLPRRGYLLATTVARENAASAVAGSLDPLVLPRPMAGRPMVMVLPFETIGGDPQDYFSDGLTADLVTDLTHFQDLHVVSPRRHHAQLQSPDTARPSGEDLPEARYVLRGSVRRDADRIRVTVRLEDAPSGASLWADRFDRPLDNLFAAQEELANRIAGRLDSQVRQDGLRRARRRPVASHDAYDLYLQGRDLHGRTTAADTLAAREALGRAIAMDPDYAPAHAWLAYTVQRGFTFDWGEPKGRAALDLALRFANRAVALEPDSALCLIRLAFVLSLLGRSEEALETGRAAVLANPCDLGGRAGYGEILSHAGEHEAAVGELRLAIKLNPFHPPFWRATFGRALLLAGHPEAALTELQRCAALAPDYRPCHTSLVVAYVESGRMEEARGALRDLLRLRPNWVLSTYDGVWGFRRQIDIERFLGALRAAGLPSG